MISKGNSPTAAQERWWSWLIDQGCCICEDAPEIHHIAGAAFKLKPHGKIGNWLVLPLCYYHHRDPTNKANVNEWKKNFEIDHGKQMDILKKLYSQYTIETGAAELDFI